MTPRLKHINNRLNVIQQEVDVCAASLSLPDRLLLGDVIVRIQYVWEKNCPAFWYGPDCAEVRLQAVDCAALTGMLNCNQSISGGVVLQSVSGT